MTKAAIDVSYHNVYSPLQYDILASGIDGAIVRTSFGLTQDSRHKTHLKEFRDRGVAVAGYHWTDPTRYLPDQVNLISRMAKENLLSGMFSDAEQYWTNWTAYMAQDLTEAYRTRYSPEHLNKYYRDTFNGVRESLSQSGIETGNYSADWFIDRYAPDMKTWVFDHNYWEAKYLRYYNPSGLNSMYGKLGKPFDISHLPEFESVAPIDRGIGRQFESLLYINGLYQHQDYNLFTDEGFNRMFGTSYPTDPPVVEPPIEQPAAKTYVINTFALNIRSGPGIEYPKVGMYWTGQKVSVSDISGDWGLTDKGWIHLGYTLPVQSAYVVNTAYLTIREYPTVNSKAVGWLKYGDHVYQVSTSGIWINIGRGWVNSGYLKPV